MSFKYKYKLFKFKYKLGLRWWPGIPINQSTNSCPHCEAAIDEHGDHLLCCRHTNFTQRHNAVQTVLLDALQAARIPNQREAPLTVHNATVTTAQHLRPADILLPSWQNSRHLAVDITISHPTQSSEAPFTSEKAKSFLKRKETAKWTKYEIPCKREGWDFQALAFDSWGSVGPQSFPLLHRITQKCASQATPRLRADTITHLKQRLSIALMRQVWIQLAPGSAFCQ